MITKQTEQIRGEQRDRHNGHWNSLSSTAWKNTLKQPATNSHNYMFFSSLCHDYRTETANLAARLFDHRVMCAKPGLTHLQREHDKTRKSLQIYMIRQDFRTEPEGGRGVVQYWLDPVRPNVLEMRAACGAAAVRNLENRRFFCYFGWGSTTCDRMENGH